MRRQSAKDPIRRPPVVYGDAMLARIDEILLDVRMNGDAALSKWTSALDGCIPLSLSVDRAEALAAWENLAPAVQDALQRARANVARFHAAGLGRPYQLETEPGISVSQVLRPIPRVGIYVPSGTAPLPSSVLMQAVPAKLAECSQVILCTPPQKDGRIDPVVLAAAHLCDVDAIFCVGGAQAIAAMAYGTATIPKVDKIFGPGNAWVTGAKMRVSQDAAGASIDMPAGPSEVMVVADDTANPAFIASDLLSQAEHGTDSQVVLVAMKSGLADQVEAEIQRLLPRLERRAIIERSLEHAIVVEVSDRREALSVINRYAPEHLILQVAEAESWVPGVHNAGSVFCGAWTPESVGDYASGSNHVLPTGGWARSQSGLTVSAFQKTMTVQTLTAGGLQALGQTVTTLARAERLEAHALAIDVRLAALNPLTAPEESRAKDSARLARPSVLNSLAYVSARSQGTARRVMLDANEAAWAGGPFDAIHRYPDPQPEPLRSEMARFYGVDATQLLVTRGADEAIDLLIRTFCEPGLDSILVHPPTYGYYAVCADLHGSAVRLSPLDPRRGFSLDEEHLLRAAPAAKLSFFCSPNNPTGNRLDPATIGRVLEATAGKGLVVIDEAYIEFSDAPSATQLLAKHKNLVVLRTLSKAWGLAGARVGALIADSSIIAVVRKVLAPYPVSRPVAALVQDLFREDATERLRERVETIVRLRQDLAARLRVLPAVEQVLPSETNFLLVQFRNQEAWIRRLSDQGIFVRDRSEDVAGCVRITVGSPAENQELLAVLGGES